MCVPVPVGWRGKEGRGGRVINRHVCLGGEGRGAMNADLMLSEVARAALVLHIICEMRRDVGWLAAANRQGDGEGTRGTR